MPCALRTAASGERIPVTTVAKTIVDIAGSLSIDELARACHEAGVRYGTSPAAVMEVLERRPNAPGAGKLRRVLSGDERVTLSKLEKRFLARLSDAGLPLPETNRRAGGRPRRLPLARAAAHGGARQLPLPRLPPRLGERSPSRARGIRPRRRLPALHLGRRRRATRSDARRARGAAWRPPSHRAVVGQHSGGTVPLGCRPWSRSSRRRSLLSAALVFLVQPMFAKFVLPLYGSTPAVWNTSLVFFQAALLAAYLYAHVSTQRLGVRRQAARPPRAGAAAAAGAARSRCRTASSRPARATPCCRCWACWRWRWGCRSSWSRPPRRCCSAGSPPPTTPPRPIRTSSTAPATSAASSACSATRCLMEPSLKLDDAGLGVVGRLSIARRALGRLCGSGAALARA